MLALLIGTVPAAGIAIALGPEVAPNASNTVSALTCAFATCTVAVVTALACIAPARRALRIQPTDALKSE